MKGLQISEEEAERRRLIEIRQDKILARANLVQEIAAIDAKPKKDQTKAEKTTRTKLDTQVKKLDIEIAALG